MAYYEVDGLCQSGNVCARAGFRGIEATSSASPPHELPVGVCGHKLFFDTAPSTTETSTACGDEAVIGCGIASLPCGDRVVFYTVQGDVQHAALACTLQATRLLPCVAGRFEDINFGAKPFVFSRANLPEVRSRMAMNLHE